MPSSRPTPDQAARDLIRQRLDINLLVEAGAGSGKTECLAQRMAAGVLDGRYAVQEMAAVTFTRKAAAELRGRFQLTLERALEVETDATRKGRAHQALRHLERLFAGTIHAFCAHLLRERPVEAGVAPGFSELDEIAQMDQQRRAWRDYLDRQRALGSPVLHELIEAKQHHRKVKTIEEPEKTAKVVNLMDALRRSVKGGEGGPSHARRARGRGTAKRTARRGGRRKAA